MSYSFNYPCYNCLKSDPTKEDRCKDAEKIREAVTAIHSSNDGSHQGSGEILLSCVKIDAKCK